MLDVANSVFLVSSAFVLQEMRDELQRQQEEQEATCLGAAASQWSQELKMATRFGYFSIHLLLSLMEVLAQGICPLRRKNSPGFVTAD